MCDSLNTQVDVQEFNCFDHLHGQCQLILMHFYSTIKILELNHGLNQTSFVNSSLLGPKFLYNSLNLAERKVGHILGISHALMLVLLAVWAACLAFSTTSLALWRSTNRVPSKSPSFLGRPWVPSAKVKRPENEEEELSHWLKALFNNVFTLKSLSCKSLHAISVFDKV